MDGSRSDRPPPEDEAPGRRFVERVLRDAVRRVVETGVEKIAEGPENIRNFVADLKLPKDIANYLLFQVDETKAGLYRVFAKEVSGFLQQTNVAEELTKALSSVRLEITTQIRFVPTEKDDATSGQKAAQGRPPAAVRLDPDPKR